MRKLFSIFAILYLTACSSRELEMRYESKTTLRHEVGVREARNLVRISNVDIAVHDSDPTGSKEVIICLHAIGHGGRDFEVFESHCKQRYCMISLR
jgi:hypothetical protein